MKSTNWKDIAELIGITAIVASLIFVGLQMQQAREIAIADGNLANAANKIESNTAIVQNSAIWVRGNAGEELNPEDRTVFHYLIQNTFDVAFFEVVRLRRLGADQIADTLVADFSAFLFENPGARTVWSDWQLSVNDNRMTLIGSSSPGHAEFVSAVRSNLARLDQLQE